ncbi:hypothetical protein ACL2XO_06250 [Sodalis sp. RH15]|uniref:hypothetical protein n=1 Tax=Sodalis sp. RH15 TaxID=3394330 RepID=UPI0039B37E43
MKINFFYSLIFYFIIFSAQAGKDELIFSCKTDNNQHISVIKNGEILEYKFGKQLNHPSLKIVTTTKNVIKDFENAEGRYTTNSIGFKNKEYVYYVVFQADRIEENKQSYYINVEKNQKNIATIYCIINTVKDNILELE